MKASIVFNVLPRLTALLLVYEVLSIPTGLSITGLLTGIWGIAGQAVGILGLIQYVAMALIVLTLLTGSVTTYSLTLAVIMVLRLQAGAGYIPVTGFVGLPALLFIDNLKTTYRDDQPTTIIYDKRLGFHRSVFKMIALLTPLLLPTLAISYYVYSLNNYLLSVENPFTSIIKLNRLMILGFTVGLLTASYKVVSSLFEIIPLFIYPSRKLSLDTLTSRMDIDIWFKPVFNIIRSIVFGSIIAPFIFAGLDGLVSAVLLHLYYTPEGFIPGIIMYMVRLTFPYLSFIAGGYIAGKLVSAMYSLNPKRALLIPILVLTILYVVSAMHTYILTKNILYALLNPSLDRLVLEAEAVFNNYYASFFILIDTVGNFLGVAP
uniref:Uncharacterized protein n=1 Tax=Thermosphaera aggregans TaxID=54254 RepID=A0A7C2BKM5_9CREN